MSVQAICQPAHEREVPTMMDDSSVTNAMLIVGLNVNLLVLKQTLETGERVEVFHQEVEEVMIVEEAVSEAAVVVEDTMIVEVIVAVAVVVATTIEEVEVVTMTEEAAVVTMIEEEEDIMTEAVVEEDIMTEEVEEDTMTEEAEEDSTEVVVTEETGVVVAAVEVETIATVVAALVEAENHLPLPQGEQGLNSILRREKALPRPLLPKQHPLLVLRVTHLVEQNLQIQQPNCWKKTNPKNLN